MNYYLTYNKKNGNITGFCKVFDINSLPEPRIPDEGFIEVTQKKYIDAIVSLNSRKERIKGKVQKEKIEELALEPIFLGEIHLSTNAKDHDDDGFPELPADGESMATLKATLLDTKGKIFKDKSVKIKYRVSRGTLSKRQVQTKNGIAEVKLRSALETTRCEINVSASEFGGSFLVMEFIPVEEYEMLASGKGKSKKK